MKTILTSLAEGYCAFLPASAENQTEWYNKLEKHNQAGYISYPFTNHPGNASNPIGGAEKEVLTNYHFQSLSGYDCNYCHLFRKGLESQEIKKHTPRATTPHMLTLKILVLVLQNICSALENYLIK